MERCTVRLERRDAALVPRAFLPAPARSVVRRWRLVGRLPTSRQTNTSKHLRILISWALQSNRRWHCDCQLVCWEEVSDSPQGDDRYDLGLLLSVLFRRLRFCRNDGIQRRPFRLQGLCAYPAAGYSNIPLYMPRVPQVASEPVCSVFVTNP